MCLSKSVHFKTFLSNSIKWCYINNQKLLWETIAPSIYETNRLSNLSGEDELASVQCSGTIKHYKASKMRHKRVCIKKWITSIKERHWIAIIVLWNCLSFCEFWMVSFTICMAETEVTIRVIYEREVKILFSMKWWSPYRVFHIH